MEYQVILDFLYLNEPIYRRVDGVPQARLVSSVLSVNAEPASQHGIYPWTPDSDAASPASTTNAAGASLLFPDLFTPSRALCDRLVPVGSGNVGVQSMLNPANAHREYYTDTSSSTRCKRIGTLVRHFLRTGFSVASTKFYFEVNPDRGIPVSVILYDPLADSVPTTATAPAPDSASSSSGFRRQGGYKRSSTTTSRNKKLIRRTRRQNRSRK
jgi:hypothetical protein